MTEMSVRQKGDIYILDVSGRVTGHNALKFETHLRQAVSNVTHMRPAGRLLVNLHEAKPVSGYALSILHDMHNLAQANGSDLRVCNATSDVITQLAARQTESKILIYRNEDAGLRSFLPRDADATQAPHSTG